MLRTGSSGWCLVCILFLWGATTALGQESTKIKRWAVIADQPTSTSGFSDMLVAELTKQDMELVERESIAKIANEQSIRLLTSGNVSERLRIGRLVEADALVILRHAPAAIDNSAKDAVAPATTQPKLQVILCECRQGARLGSTSFNLSRVEKLVPEIGRMIVDRAAQFVGGLQRIVAVAPLHP